MGRVRKIITLACTPVCYDENGCDIDYAVVTLDKEIIKTFLGRISLVKGLKHLIPTLNNLEEFNYMVEYLKYDEREKQMNIGEEWAEISVPENLATESVRIDTPTLVVFKDAVYWDAYIKHTNIRISTAHLCEGELTKMIEQMGGGI